MNFEEFLKLKIEEQNTKNTVELSSFLETENGKTKIKNLIKRNPDLLLENIIEDVKNGNPYAIALLRKDPKKQNVSEKAFFEFTQLEKLPQSGENAIRFGNSKSADFKVNDWFGTQKYIEEAGGAQDNQINDAFLFAEEANKAGKKAIVCIDGDYGKKIASQRKTENDNCIVLTADELKEGILNGRFN